MSGFWVVGFIILVGYLAARYGILAPAAGAALTRTAFFITNPALLFTVLAKADLTGVFSTYAPLAITLACLTAGIYIAASRLWFQRSAAETAIGAMASSYVNANNIGLPLAVYALGTAAPVAPVLMVQLLLLAPAYLTVLDISSGRRFSLKTALTQPVRNPMILASFLGAAVAVGHLQLPSLLEDPLQLLGGAAVPLVLMAFGMSLSGAGSLRFTVARTDLIVTTLLKTVIMPVLAVLVGRFVFRLDNVHLLGAVVMAALPTAQNVFLFASRYDKGVALARDTALISSGLAIPALIVSAWFLT
jgi:malonate transporter